MEAVVVNSNLRLNDIDTDNDNHYDWDLVN